MKEKFDEIWVIRNTDINILAQFPLLVSHNTNNSEWSTKMHTHDFYELVYCVGGEVEESTRSGKRILKPGMVYIMCPGEDHSPHSLAGATTYMANFTMNLFGGELTEFLRVPGMMELFFYHFLVKGMSSTPCFCLSIESADEFTSLLDKIITPPGIITGDILNTYRKNLFMNALMILGMEYAAQHGTLNGITNNGRLITSLIFIENLIDLENNKIAERIYSELDITKQYFFSFFKKHMGMPFFEYITNRKIIKSCSLLYTDKSITQIAHELGFYDAAHFAHKFKKVIGITPKEYRKNIHDT